MKKFVAYDETTGEVLYSGTADDPYALETDVVKILEDGHVRDGGYIENDVWQPVPTKPSEFHDWDWPTKAWKPNLSDALTKRKGDVATEQAKRNFSTITYDGKVLDADATAQNNLANKIIEVDKRVARGRSMPAGLLIWRDADNVTHSFPDIAAYSTWLDGFAIALSERGTRLYVAAWQHKAALDALTTVEDILAYDVTQGW